MKTIYGTTDVEINGVQQIAAGGTGATTAAAALTALGAAPASAFTGSNATSAGTAGLVPAPAANDNTKFLKGDGTWADVSSTGGTPILTLNQFTVPDDTTIVPLSSNVFYSVLKNRADDFQFRLPETAANGDRIVVSRNSGTADGLINVQRFASSVWSDFVSLGFGQAETFYYTNTWTREVKQLGVVDKSGDTMTGKLNLPASTTSGSSLNIAQGADPSSPAFGDIWATPAGIRTRTGFISSPFTTTLAALERSQTFTHPQTINAGSTAGSVFSVTNNVTTPNLPNRAAEFIANGTAPVVTIVQNSNELQAGAGLLIRNANGTGECLRIEDESPETTPFVVNASGRVGIGGAPDSTVGLKLDSTGVKFNDGTVQTTAAAQQNADWSATSGVTQILNKPTIPAAPTNFTGSNATSAGTAGLVPAPAANDNTKFLKGDGSWADTPSATPNSLSIGTVDTGAAGSSASASITGTAPSQTLSLTIPRGDKGDTGNDGTAATVAVGTVNTGNAGSSASVTNVGTTSAAVLDFTIPRGNAGTNGTAVLSGSGNPQGTQGAIGDFYINTSTNFIFGPKVNTGSWPAGVSLAGANGKTILNGTLNPTTSDGATGDFYLNTALNRLFGPKTTNVTDDTTAWGSGVGLVGPANSLTIGTVDTGAAGSSASASITGTAPSQILSLTIPQGTPGGPGFHLVLFRSQNALFENSSFVGPSNWNLGLPGSGGGGRYPVTGNTVEGWFANDTAFPRIFNPLRYLGPGNYRITMYVRVSGAFNDGVHCQLRINQSGVSNSLNNLILPTEFGNLRQFGGGNSGSTDRIYYETSNTLSAADQWIQYVPCFGAYGPTGGNNGAYIQDVSLFFFKV